MRPSHGTFEYGKETFPYRVKYAHRRTLEIAVYPDKSVVVTAPAASEFSAVERKVVKRAGWIKRQVDFFRQFDPKTPKRRFVGGETHLFLGRRYRLKITRGPANEVKLSRGTFQVVLSNHDSADHIRDLLGAWYAEKANDQFEVHFAQCWVRFQKLGIPKPRVQVRRLKKRWGSLSSNGLLTLNIDLVRAPTECIDYVITHELCHLQHHDHGTKFYRLLDRMMPDWEKRKHRLELALA